MNYLRNFGSVLISCGPKIIGIREEPIMPRKSRPTILKREKERARLQKRKEKEARRAELRDASLVQLQRSKQRVPRLLESMLALSLCWNRGNAKTTSH